MSAKLWFKLNNESHVFVPFNRRNYGQCNIKFNLTISTNNKGHNYYFLGTLLGNKEADG